MTPPDKSLHKSKTGERKCETLYLVQAVKEKGKPVTLT